MQNNSVVATLSDPKVHVPVYLVGSINVPTSSVVRMIAFKL